MTVEGFLSARPVSRETLARLETYHELLVRWNATINLVAPASITAAWSRHFLDSTQVFDLAPDVTTGNWVDIGSGGGFPGMVAAILAAQERPDLKITLVESDQRKAAFMRTVARQTGVQLSILTDRAETLPPMNADILSARAVAPLEDLLAFAALHLRPGGCAVFPKGARHSQEIAQALEKWRFTYEKHQSITDPDAVVLMIKEIARV